ncbi:sugar-binding domain-containing protein [Ancylomarina sp. 16SWW S1-10-2]|uniref:sugar-binding domain-containing protein n=1 Tax=Ancylomarina sp. 16SWW S1-10-2 TaxID=2499681 RepID=UPI001E29D65D|nr:sugar-binding domain-containing protein [Ancylomarina sp. 16SWW S1-10-2]
MINKIMIGLLFLLMIGCQSNQNRERELDFNFGWKFSLEHANDAYAVNLVDSSWRDVNLPHDWSIEFPFDSIKGEGCTGYLPGGLGWYRKHFTLEGSADELTYVLFDGVYNNSEVWLNGKRVGEHPYGYSPFYFDLTPYLNPAGKDNVLAVKVDHTRYADSRWYTGSGIYRNVKLIRVNKLHIPIWGRFITTPEVSTEKATVSIDITVANDFETNKSLQIITEFYSPNGEKVKEIVSDTIELIPGEKTLKQTVVIDNPMLWSVDTPNLYKAVSRLVQGDNSVDVYESTFGIRSIRFDKDQGFFLNDVNMKIKGVCQHHDGGLVGAAVPKGVWRRRLQILKDGGCNALRIAHNPASDELLDLCDEMGFLVQDEFFDEWDYPKDKRLNMKESHDDYITRGYGEHFQEWAQFDLKNTMLAHRNHPSVFQWSIGNEIEWTYPRNKKATGFFNNMNWEGGYFWSQPPFSPEKIRSEYNKMPAMEHTIGETANKLARWTKELDTSRPVIANCILPSASFETGYTDALDIVGFSYRRVMYDYAKKNYPNKIVMGTENLGQWHEWKAIEDRPFVSGTFLWTGTDYLGESNGHWPKKATASGLVDLAAFPKPSYHMYKTLWSDEPHIYICSNSTKDSQYEVNKSGKVIEKKPGAWKHALWEWYNVIEHWNYATEKDVIVEVISNCPKVELFLNGESLGIKSLSDFEDRIYKWAVPYQKGKLEAKGVKDGQEISANIATSTEPVSIQLSVDKTSLNADGYEVAHIIAQLYDKDNNPVIINEASISFELEGNIKLLGVDNGSASSTQTYQSNTVRTNKGRCLLIVQSTRKSGVVKISALSGSIKSDVIQLTIK